MTKYNVHLYREMRLLFKGVEANSQEEAADIVCNAMTDDADACEDCEGNNIAALVDVVGDEDYKNSVMMNFFELLTPDKHKEVIYTIASLIECLRDVLPYAEQEYESLRECNKRDGDCDEAMAACELSIEKSHALLNQIEKGL